MTKGCRELREELEILTARPKDIVDRQQNEKWLDQQIQRICALREKFPHTIILRARLSSAIEEANCFTYALGIDVDAVRDMCYGQTIFPGSVFVTYLLQAAFESKDMSAAVDGDIVLYFDDSGKPVHSGIWKEGKIISKWGAGLTHVWEHELYDVPISYGNNVLVVASISPEQAVDAFDEWSRGQ